MSWVNHRPQQISRAGLAINQLQDELLSEEAELLWEKLATITPE